MIRIDTEDDGIAGAREVLEILIGDTPMFRDSNGVPLMNACPALAYTAINMLRWLIDEPVHRTGIIPYIPRGAT